MAVPARALVLQERTAVPFEEEAVAWTNYCCYCRWLPASAESAAMRVRLLLLSLQLCLLLATPAAVVMSQLSLQAVMLLAWWLRLLGGCGVVGRVEAQVPAQR